MSDGLYLVLSDPHPGQDGEFNRWYIDEHMPEVLSALPGLAYAQRFRRMDADARSRQLPGYMTIYGVTSGAEGELARAVEVQRNRVIALGGGPDSSARLRISPSMDTSTLVSGIYLPISELRRPGP
jgi:hypothetical protein